MSSHTLRLCLAAAALAAAASPVPAQGGAGVPGGYFSHRGSVIGGHLVVDYGYPGLGTGVGVISFSDGFGPVQHPFFGLIWFDTNSPAYTIVVQAPDAQGNVHLEADIPADPALVLAPPIYVNGFMADGVHLPPPHWALSKTVSFTFENRDGYRPVADLNEARVLHTATGLAAGPGADDVRVLIAGGGIGTMFFPAPSPTTELYSPLRRVFDPGPAMSVPRMKHQAVRLQDGRILVIGGLSTGLLATDSCEIFDPASGAFTATGSMNAPRFGHQATLLQDGRVLVTGGMTSWAGAAVDLVGRLNTSQAAAEIYEPATGSWTATAPMSVPRTGHTHTLLPDGRVVLIGGIIGGSVVTNPYGTTPNGQVPVMTGVAEAFDPAAGVFQALITNNAFIRAFHGASLLPDGTLLVSGGLGFAFFTQGSTPTIHVVAYDVSLGTVTSEPPLVTGGSTGPGVWLHQQIASRGTGEAIILGGFTDAQTYLNTTSRAWRHSGAAAYQALDLGQHAVLPGGAAFPAAGFAIVPLYNDFTYLVCGGWTGGGSATVSRKAFLMSEQ